MTFTELKKQAFSLFKESLGSCIAASLTVSLIKAAIVLVILTMQLVGMKIFGLQCIFGPVSAVFYILYALTYVFIFIPLNMGKSFFALKVAQGERPNTDTVFGCFKSEYFYVLGIKLRQMLVYAIWTAIVFVAGMFFDKLGINWLYSLAAKVVLLAIVLIVLSVRYSALAYGAQLCGMKDVHKTMRKSVRVSRGHKHSVFALVMTQIGWLLLSVLTLGIAFIYISITVKKYYLSVTNERGF